MGFKSAEKLRVLCLGAHSDDIEIGCGGTILKLIRENKNIRFYWVIFSADKKRTKEALDSAESFLKGVNKKQVKVLSFQESYFPYKGSEIKSYFDALREEYDPNLVFTHYRLDLHQDHRLISELTWNTFRNHMILEYEIAKYDGDLGCPNFFVILDRRICMKKIRLITENFKSQKNKKWFNREVFLFLLRMRGMEANAASGYAEAFYGRKIVF